MGYWATGASGSTPSLTTGHGYLGDLTLLAVPFTAAVVLYAFRSGGRREALRLRLAPLSAMQVLLYVAVELAEHLGAGMSPAASLVEPSMRFGALAQVLIAGGLWLALHLVHRAGGAISLASARPQDRRSRPSRWEVAAQTWATPVVDAGSLSRRGPPWPLLSLLS